MKIRSPGVIKVQILCILLLFCSFNPCFAQNPDERGQKIRTSREGSKDPYLLKSPLPVVANGNIVLGTPTAGSITASVMIEKDGEA